MNQTQPEKHTEEHTEMHACDCISRQAAIDFFLDKGMITAAVYIERMPDVGTDLSGYSKRLWQAGVKRGKEEAEAERKRGKWMPHEDEDGEHYGDKCSECGEWYVMPHGKTNFCPNCGADMRGGGEG